MNKKMSGQFFVLHTVGGKGANSLNLNHFEPTPWKLDGFPRGVLKLNQQTAKRLVY